MTVRLRIWVLLGAALCGAAALAADAIVPVPLPAEFGLHSIGSAEPVVYTESSGEPLKTETRRFTNDRHWANYTIVMPRADGKGVHRSSRADRIVLNAMSIRPCSRFPKVHREGAQVRAVNVEGEPVLRARRPAFLSRAGRHFAKHPWDDK